MGAYRYAGCLGYVLLVILQVTAANPMLQSKPPFSTPEYPGCPMYQVGQKFPTQQVTLDDQVTFLVRPSHSMLVMDIAISDQQIYQASVDGTMIKISECGIDHTSCKDVDGGGTKSTDFLNVNQWNNVTVSLVDSQISVSVNMNENVMGNLMTVKSRAQQEQSTLQVSIFGSNTQSTTTLPDGYNVDVNLYCNMTYTPTVEQMPENPDYTTASTETIPAPNPECPVYEVGPDSEMQTWKMEDKLNLFLLPSQPLMCFDIMVQQMMYKATIDGTMIVLSKCDEEGENCEVDEQGGSKGSDLLEANEWNEVTFSLNDSEISVSVNGKANVMSSSMLVQPDTESVEVTIVAPNTSSQSVSSDYTVSVNVACNETFSPTPVIRQLTTSSTDQETSDSDITTINPLNTPNAVVETSTPEPSAAVDQTTTIIIVIVALVLLIVIVALVVSALRKRRTATINQHTPLQQQQQ